MKGYQSPKTKTIAVGPPPRPGAVFPEHSTGLEAGRAQHRFVLAGSRLHLGLLTGELPKNTGHDLYKITSSLHPQIPLF